MKTFEKAIQLAPDNAELWIELGKSLRDLKRSTEALLSFQRALTLDPRRWEAANGAGVLLHQLGRIEEALSYSFDVTKFSQIKPQRCTRVAAH